MSAMNLPTWASDGGLNARGCQVIDVDAEAMYVAILSEYRDHFRNRLAAAGLPTTAPTEAKKATKWLADAAEAGLPPGFEEFDPDSPTAYAAEVAYQSMKLDLWVAAKSSNLEIRIHDREKRFALRGLPPGRGVDAASGGLGGAKEARAHYKALRGFLPV